MKYDLKMCVWEITLACCFSCKYCGSAGGRARENELTTAECLDVADQLKELGCRRVSMIGGEVFMRRDWKQIVKRLTDNGIRVNIITNGFLFREEQIKDLKDVRIESISISIDGPKAVHDKYRQEGSFDRAALAMETLLSSGIPVSVISTLNGENVKYLEEMFKFLRKYSIYAWQLQACSPMGNAATGGIDYRFDMQDVINFVTSHMYEAPFAMGVADNIGYFTEAEGSIRGNLSGSAFFRG
nr:radical SAM protein [Lachnospiraceae bacterium]